MENVKSLNEIEEKLPKSVDEAREIFKQMSKINPLVRKLHVKFSLGAPETEDEDII
jgi:hypothetical protein